MVPLKDGKANEGHSCVKGRFAWGYTSHKDRQLHPMVRESIVDEWRRVSWDEAISYTASRLKEIQAEYGTESIGGISSSRCTNEEVFAVQQRRYVRARLPFADRLRAWSDLRHVGRHPGLPLGGALRGDTADRGQPHGRPPGLRLTDEASPGAGGSAHRDRPAAN